MDLSPLIFVALAIAWAVYLVPKALKHHEDVVRSRSVDRFSDSMRVLARREPVDGRRARLVMTPLKRLAGRGPAGASDTPTSEPATAAATSAPAASSAPARPAARPAAARSAARRRRRVLLAVLALVAVVTGLAVAGVVSGWVVTAPVALLVAWLVACRVMVKGERRGRAAVRPAGRPVRRPAAPAAPGAEAETFDPASDPEPVAPVAERVGESTEEISVVRAELAAVAAQAAPEQEGLWDPVPVTLPTYVSKPAAERRGVRTIDLDSTGVWTSGRSAADSALAREAEESERAAKARVAGENDTRAVGT